MLERAAVVVLSMMMFLGLSSTLSYAGSAETLPKGITRVGVNTRFFLPFDERFDPDGNTEKIATDLNANLNSTLFPGLLGPFELPPPFGFGLPAGSASIGNSEVEFDYRAYELRFSMEYGITNRLSVGVLIPYRWIENDVNAKVNTENATVGFNPLFGQPGDPFGVPLIPVVLGGVKDDAQATELIQDTLVDDFGFQRVEDWSDDGFLDIEVGFRYQYLRTENWALAFTGALRFPTGAEDDPDNLVDIGFGEGVYALLFRLDNDYVGVKDLRLNFRLGYNLQLPDTSTKRVPDSPNQPLTRNKDNVDRDLGDIVTLETEGRYEFLSGLTFSLLYRYQFKFEDSIDGSQGFAYESLEEESDATLHLFKIALTYSTVPLYVEKKFSVPLTASIIYRNRFAGSNNTYKTQYIALDFRVFF